MDILAISLWDHWIWPLMLFIIGLGAVVFFHELGHFMVAKWVGIKVERFAIGMGPRLFGIQRGDTDYCLCALPLGGYVKMLGQEDFKSLDENQQADPRAFSSKSVGARFAVISAGVIMNIILAAILFVIVGMVGMDFAAPYIGSVAPGSPAGNATITWNDADGNPAATSAPAATITAAATPSIAAATSLPSTAPAATATTLPAADDYIQPGDKIVRLEGDSLVLSTVGNQISHFADIKMTAVLAKPEDKYTFTLERVVDGKVRTGRATIGVKPSGGMLVFGMTPAESTTLKSPDNMLLDTPFRSGDTIIAVNGQPVNHYWDITKLSRTFDGRPASVTVLRDGKETKLDVPVNMTNASGDLGGYSVLYLKDGTILRGRLTDISVSDDGKVKSTVVSLDGTRRSLSDEQFHTDSLIVLGMVPRLKIAQMTEGSAADKAGLKVGDIVTRYGDRETPTHHQFIEITKEISDSTSIIVSRNGESKKFDVSPQTLKSGGVTRKVIGTVFQSDLDNLLIAGVLPNSPAAKAGIEPGARITAVNGQAVATWPELYRALSASMGKPVELTYHRNNSSKTVQLGTLQESMFSPKDYEFDLMRTGSSLMLKPMTVKIREMNPVSACLWGGKETFKQVLQTYVSFRSLAQGSVSTDNLTGPIGMGALAVQIGRQGLIEFVYFMAFISAALAVFNFLPIPVVDGGHAVFLLIEKVRGKPVPIKVMDAVQKVGLLLLVALFLYVTWNDIVRIVYG